MKLSSIKYGLLLWCCCISMGISAQDMPYAFSHLDVNNGLSHNGITSIKKDAKGFLWFGTLNGLNRFDGSKFKVYKHRLNDASSISDNFITNIYDAPGNRFWIKTQLGYAIYDPETDSFNEDVATLLHPLDIQGYQVDKILKGTNGDFYFLYTDHGIVIMNEHTRQINTYSTIKGDSTSLHGVNLADIALDERGDLWISYQDGWVEQFDTRTHKVVYHAKPLYQEVVKNKAAKYQVYIDQQQDIWLFAGNSDGLYYYSATRNLVKHFYKDAPENKLLANVVNTVMQDQQGKIWIATDPGGVHLLDKSSFRMQHILRDERNPNSLSQNSITTLYSDSSGMIWLGTYKKGINYYYPDIFKFPLYSHNPLQPEGLNYSDINAFAEDAKGNLWLGSNGGGLTYYDRQKDTYKAYVNDKSNPHSLSTNVIVSLCVDHLQNLWVGTYLGGLDYFDGKTFTHYRHDDQDPNSLSDNRIYEIMEDSEQRIWMGTLGGGVNIFDPATKTFTHLRREDSVSIHSNYVFTLLEDRRGDIWIGTSNGIDVLHKKTRKFVHYQHDNNDPGSLANDNILSMIEDSRGYLCIGTREGLNIFNPNTGKFLLFREEDGLPDNNILGIREDKKHHLWISTANGISNAIVTADNERYKLNFINYDVKDGLQGKQYNEDASWVTAKGEMVFGGGNGFNIFDPAAIKMNSILPELVFTDFQLFNHTVKTGEKINGKVILPVSITITKNIVLNYNQNFFSIEFAALDFLSPDKIRYQYKMEGLDENWVASDNKIRKAAYTNLDPGNYVFKVRSSTVHDTWNENVLSLNIQILPPFWKTQIAYTCYALLIIALLLYGRYRGIKKIRTQFLLEQEKQEVQRIREQEREEARRLHELDRLKIKFLTNVSHEFRTPLSLIIAPLDKMLKDPLLADQNAQVSMIRRNVRRLLNLVNQLLDFRKMEVYELKLDMKSGDIIRFIKEVSFSFMDIAEQKNIEFAFDTDVPSLDTSFDHDKIERILFNLLSNAFKFTPAGGHVGVFLNYVAEPADTNLVHLRINVMDSGIGIPPEKVDKIFDRFYQHDIPASLINQGSGIGLSITREFVKLHQGTIHVESITDGGSCFIVDLPLKVESTEEAPADPKVTASPAQEKHKRPTVLLVEDNDDFRFYLKDNLQDYFCLLEAANGKEGWQKALALHPDLIVSDVSMPEMNGLELCAKIKQDKRTSHIPIILLTALVGEEYQIKGLETGANDYLCKPFNFEMLVSKIRNLLTLQTTIKKVYTKQVEVQVADMSIQSVDEKFIAAALSYVEENLQNANLSVAELSKHLCISRVSLYKKMLLLTGKTPVDFIRSIRLKKAAQMLEKSQLSIAEISYEVGFNTPHYFTKSFKAEFGVLPSAYIKQSGKDSSRKVI
ncbi:hybrid sensor histidine kinase/response regulator transcription factor [Chitinophaga arvensicola]|uniref:histidine kinase n=1 Tax=Chitinophaga arvensicola TaxID=29529 RepID=A0A1I0SDN6_9BACT|nr:two-component regulator propeller domain-containing protein [Chitinophaga arvensicola]SEW56323.1 Signal transduction histidine kinase [Chitinophaga arvensicola]